MLSGFAAIIALVSTPAHAVNYNVQDIIGAYEKVSPVCADGSTVGHLVPCARHCDNPETPNDETEPCSVCHLIVLGHNIVKYVLFISVFIALAVITFAGVIYITSAGDQGMISTAKGALKAALFGMIFVLAAWVIVNTLITIFLPVNNDAFQGGLKGNWMQYYCESAGSGDDKTNPTTGGDNKTNPTTSRDNKTNPTTSGGDKTNPITDTTKTGMESKIKDPNTYSGTKYCNVSRGATHVIMDTNECYSDQKYCENKFGKNCRVFAPGAPTSQPYDAYHVELEIVAPLQNNKVIVPKMILDIPAGESDTNPMQPCLNFIADMQKSAQNANGELRISKNCVGMLAK